VAQSGTSSRYHRGRRHIIGLYTYTLSYCISGINQISTYSFFIFRPDISVRFAHIRVDRPRSSRWIFSYDLFSFHSWMTTVATVNQRIIPCHEVIYQSGARCGKKSPRMRSCGQATQTVWSCGEAPTTPLIAQRRQRDTRGTEGTAPRVETVGSRDPM
jgi:hypothetical protein